MQVSAGTFLLPVELDLQVKHNGKNHTNELYWITASEINNDHFEVMRVVDGHSFWKPLERLKAAAVIHM